MNFSITHLSTACTLLEIGSLRILTDPVLDQSPRRYKFAPGIYAWRRFGAALPAGGLGNIDAILLSHAHHLDNLDHAGRVFVLGARDAQDRPSRIISHPSAQNMVGHRLEPLLPWQHLTLKGALGESIKVTATPASHGPHLLRFLHDVRDVVGYLLEWETQKHGAVYISGDTIFYYELEELGAQHRIGTAILHLGGVHFAPPLPFRLRLTMTARQAAKLAQCLQPHTIVPIHYESSVWTHFKQEVPEYIDSFTDVGLRQRVRWLQKGVPEIIEV